MDADTKKLFPVNHRFMLVKLTTETADALEDLRFAQQRQERRRVTKRELVEAAIKLLVARASTTK
jgi:hypothetical protein